MTDLDRNLLNQLFSAIGEHLRAAEASVSIVVVGGASLSAGGWVERVTKDVDVIAREVGSGDTTRLVPPEPFPPALEDAIRRVARDYGLSERWLNAEIAAQWRTGLPPGLADELRWERFGPLRVGFAGRGALIALKLFAAIDRGPDSVHYRDLVGLRPSEEELDRAAGWVVTQDAAETWSDQVSEVVERVRRTT